MTIRQREEEVLHTQDKLHRVVDICKGPDAWSVEHRITTGGSACLLQELQARKRQHVEPDHYCDYPLSCKMDRLHTHQRMFHTATVLDTIKCFIQQGTRRHRLFHCLPTAVGPKAANNTADEGVIETPLRHYAYQRSCSSPAEGRRLPGSELSVGMNTFRPGHLLLRRH